MNHTDLLNDTLILKCHASFTLCRRAFLWRRFSQAQPQTTRIMRMLREFATAPSSTNAEPGRSQGRLQQLLHRVMYRYVVLQLARTDVWCNVQRCDAADWLKGAVENTTSYTPFNGAYMHYFWAFPDPDTDVLLAKAAELQNMMADHTTYFYPYDNLATDPNPGDVHHSGMSLVTIS